MRLANPPLFVYGTLLFTPVVKRVIGRVPRSEKARLVDHACFKLRNEIYPGVIFNPGSRVEGRLYRGLTPAEWTWLDQYEGRLYQKSLLSVDVGDKQREFALGYVIHPESVHRLSQHCWNMRQFQRYFLRNYLRGL